MKLSLLSILLPLALGAAEPVYVPYDPGQPAAEQTPERVYVPYEHFLNLWEAAKHARTAEAPAPAPVEFALSSARYEARLEERSLAVTGHIDLLTGHEWVKVPLAFADAKVSSLLLDGAPLALTEKVALVEKPGRHVLEVRFAVPRAPGAQTLAWGIPESAATLVALTLPQGQMTADLRPGSGAVETLNHGARVVTAALGRTPRVTLQLRSAAAPSAALGLPALATVHEEIRVGETEEETTAQIDFAFAGAAQERFTVLLDAGTELTDLQAPALQSWKLRPEGERQALELQLFRACPRCAFGAARVAPGGGPGRCAARERFGAACRAGRARAPGRRAHRGHSAAGSRPPADSARTTRSFRLAAGGRVRRRRNAGLPRRSPTGEARGAHRLPLPGRPPAGRASPRCSFAEGDPFSRWRSIFRRASPWKVSRARRPHEWWREGNRVHVRFQSETPEVTPLVIYLVRREATAPESLAVQPLRLEGFHKVTGEAGDRRAQGRGGDACGSPARRKNSQPQRWRQIFRCCHLWREEARLCLFRRKLYRRGEAPGPAGAAARRLGHACGGARKLAGPEYKSAPLDAAGGAWSGPVSRSRRRCRRRG